MQKEERLYQTAGQGWYAAPEVKLPIDPLTE